MGYESKLFIGECHKGTFPNGNNYVCFDKVAEYDLSKMGDNHFCNVNSSLFKTPIDFDLYMNRMVEELDYNEATCQTKGWFESRVREDGYGDICHYAPIKNVLDYLKKTALENDYYRRIPPLIALFETLVKEQEDGHWDDLIVVHYGY